MVRHEILGGLVQLYRRERSHHWHCSASIDGHRFRATTKEEGLEQAKQFAEDWYLSHRGNVKAGLVKKREKTFREATAKFEEEYTTITEGQRSPKWVQGHSIRIRLHLNPFFGDLGLSEVNPGKVQEYRVHRVTPPAVEPSAEDGDQDAEGSRRQ